MKGHSYHLQGTNDLLLTSGSEGILGLITEVVIRIRPIPACRVYESIGRSCIIKGPQKQLVCVGAWFAVTTLREVFPDFSLGVQALRALARANCYPASVRLLDHEQVRNIRISLNDWWLDITPKPFFICILPANFHSSDSGMLWKVGPLKTTERRRLSRPPSSYIWRRQV